MAFTLPPLPYPAAALEPHIDAATMEIHHGRHHKTYVDNLNKALEAQPQFQSKSIEDLLRDVKSVPENVRQAVINNGGGHANHSLFWTIMGPGGGGRPSGPLADDLNKAFGDFASFQAKIKENALGQFGSGWAWLVWDGSKLQVIRRPNQDSPLMEGLVPVLGVDVWEHAYYLKYQNKRADYVDAWWNTLNWSAIAERFAAAKAGK